MALIGGRIRRGLLGVREREVLCARRGFTATDPAARDRLEEIGRSFLAGYHAALERGEAGLARAWSAMPRERHGWAAEGAAMAMAILDCLTPWDRCRASRFLDSAGAPHLYMAHIGFGWALARLRRPLDRLPLALDPLLRWLVADGYGFHEGYFHPEVTARRGERPPHVTGYAARAFDQGLGRALWFVEGADPRRVAAAIEALPAPRRADLWSGAGLACAYAGAADRAAVESLRAAAGEHRLHAAQGAVFAATARDRAGNPAPHTDLAVAVLAGIGAERAAALAMNAGADLPRAGEGDGAAGEPAYETWRRRIRVALTERAEAVA